MPDIPTCGWCKVLAERDRLRTILSSLVAVKDAGRAFLRRSDTRVWDAAREELRGDHTVPCISNSASKKCTCDAPAGEGE